MNIGQKIIHLESVDSTNNYAANLLKSEVVSHGTVILTDNQYNGRGQRDSEWQSESFKSLTLSIILKPAIMTADQQVYINLCTCLSLIDVLSKYKLEALIKWPNDIFVGERKIAGILIENNLKGNFLSSSIVGIGLNVNHAPTQFNCATSMYEQTGGYFILQEVFLATLSAFNSYYDFIENQKFEDLMNYFQEKMLGIGSAMWFEDNFGVFSGVVRGIDNQGRLKIQKDNEIRFYGNKEIKWLPKNIF
jgi:BirA family biotin operon repressor/biotin-[acetyl-CoA-carboxylase] ligase